MLDEKCFINKCCATIGDCKNAKCKCLSCLGEKQDSCKPLHDELMSKAQKILCSLCVKNKDNMRG